MIAIKRGREDANSRFFGEALLPESWLGGGEFSPTELFLCQIDLSELDSACGESPLPKEGFLYFFIDFGVSPAKGIVRYALSADSLTPFNEDYEFDDDVETPFPVSFEVKNAVTGLLCDEKKLFGGEVCLLRYGADSVNGLEFLADTDVTIMFVIDKTALEKRQFEKAFLVQLTK